MVKNVLKKNEKRRKNNKGFSLVELIVVIAIMAVLVGVLAPQFIKYVEKSRQSTDMQSVSQMKDDVEAAVADEESDSTVSIAINGSTKTVTVSGVTDISSSTAKLKSAGWGTVTFTLDRATGKWSHSGTSTNSKGPKRDMAEVFSSSSSGASGGSESETE